ncbi:MAG: hypothetical protein QG653_667 [Patescibacteria group bacterium]|nr:hypothetical protein [Patescibacteria group bacterium]
MDRNLKKNLFLPLTSTLLVIFILFLASVQSPKEVFDIAQNSIIALVSGDSISREEQTNLSPYIEVSDSCGPYFDDACVNARELPSEDAQVLFKVRKGVVLKVSGKITNNGRDWYKIEFDEWLRYPERVNGGFYIASEYAKYFLNEGSIEISSESISTSTKRIIIDRSDQMLYAYDGGVLFMKEKISTGIEATPTPRGEFIVFRKMPSRYMQGPIPEISDKEYDLPGVPWNLYFTEQGAVIHGAYWHDKFGQPWSNGCVNLPVEKAKELYLWAELGTKVLVRD